MSIQILSTLGWILFLLPTLCQAGELSAGEILARVDSVLNAPKDQFYSATITLIDQNNNQKLRQTITYQQGSEKRLVRFLSPADQKGIAFLSLPNDLNYLYLPAFHKVRQIAAHVKNQNFAGTDFTYDDLSSFKYAQEHSAKILENTAESYLLEIIPKAGIKKEYQRLKILVNKSNFYATKIEYYDQSDQLWRVMTRRNIVQQKAYWIALTLELHDVKKQHRTQMVIEKIELDTNLDPQIFTQRFLQKYK